MKCVSFCCSVIVCAGVASRAALATDLEERPPNVLFIAVDDLNTRLSCYGDPVAYTPQFDRLARQGVCFERAYCQFPICNPSRVSLLLGRYPTTTQVIDFAYPALLGTDWVTLPQHFRNQGYDVRLLGKIFHFDKNLMQGWFPGEEIPGAEYPPDWSAGDKWVRRSQEVHARMLADLTRWEPYRTLAPPPQSWGTMLHTWANVFGPAPNADEGAAAAHAKPYEWTADVQHTQDAIRLLEQLASSDRPFFLGVGFYKPHVPLVVPERFFEHYPLQDLPLPSDFAPWPSAPDSVPRHALRYNLDLFFAHDVSEDDARQALAAYYACVSFVDEQLGRLLDALEQFQLRDNTVIVCWGDHGWHLGEKGMWGKGTLFDVSARAPLMIVDPRRTTAGRKCRRTVEFVDIFPTLVQLCALPAPTGLEGASLVPLLDNPDATWSKPACTLVAREDWLARSIRTERWCYTEWDEGRRGVELYDLLADPTEQHNLAADPGQTATVAELRTLLRRSPVARPIKLPATGAAP
ncbi:MAG: sulfatase [Pirellulaceae bacterium]|nr:sulfatase [Pirellulaceae bacterium]